MYCRNCGHDINSFGGYCTNCGRLPLHGRKFCQSCGNSSESKYGTCEYCQNDLKYTGIENMQTLKPDDTPDQLANFAAMCCNPPIVGLILYLIWKDEKPNKAKSVCHYTLAGLGIIVFFYILEIIFAIFNL